MAPSILSLDLKITGDIATTGEVHVSGMVKGDVVAKEITIGETGTVIGSVEAETAVVAGTLTGRLSASKVVLSSTARVVADITHVLLSIEPGAVFEGYSRRVDAIGQVEAALPLALPAARGTVTPIAGGKAAHGE
ncbi:MAG TPA: polymer-forming cytoskeletal protein [Stellaceae bacterium]|nr:polymer-forming cytoskeletal protein [Stellaceae bacterium]